MTYESSLRAAHIIQRHAALQLEVLSLRCEVSWPDGSRVDLHPVQKAGVPDRYLRALHHQGHWLVFDLRHIVPALSHELATAPERDQPGTVLYTLRANLHRANAFLQLAEQVAIARWPGSPRAADPRPTRSGAPRQPNTGAEALAA
jgi:hypothetical protein